MSVYVIDGKVASTKGPAALTFSELPKAAKTLGKRKLKALLNTDKKKYFDVCAAYSLRTANDAAFFGESEEIYEAIKQQQATRMNELGFFLLVLQLMIDYLDGDSSADALTRRAKVCAEHYGYSLFGMSKLSTELEYKQKRKN